MTHKSAPPLRSESRAFFLYYQKISDNLLTVETHAAIVSETMPNLPITIDFRVMSMCNLSDCYAPEVIQTDILSTYR